MTLNVSVVNVSPTLNITPVTVAQTLNVNAVTPAITLQPNTAADILKGNPPVVFGCTGAAVYRSRDYEDESHHAGTA